MRRRMPSFAGPTLMPSYSWRSRFPTRRRVLYLLLADPVKRLDKERDGLLLIEHHGPAFLDSSRYVASFDADSREGSKS